MIITFSFLLLRFISHMSFLHFQTEIIRYWLYLRCHIKYHIYAFTPRAFCDTSVIYDTLYYFHADIFRFRIFRDGHCLSATHAATHDMSLREVDVTTYNFRFHYYDTFSPLACISRQEISLLFSIAFSSAYATHAAEHIITRAVVIYECRHCWY